MSVVFPVFILRSFFSPTKMRTVVRDQIVLLVILFLLIHQCNPFSLRSRRGKYPRLELWIDRKVKKQDHPTNAKHLLLDHGFTESEVFSITKAFPTIELLDPQIFISPKLEFFSNTCDYCPKSTWIKQLCFRPQIFGVDLESNIAVKHAYIQYLRIPSENLFGDSQMTHWKFFDWLSLDDKEFDQSLQEAYATKNILSFAEFKKRFLRGGLAAVRDGDVDLLSILLKHGYHPDDDYDRQNRSVLMWACTQANSSVDVGLKLIKLLVSFYESSHALSHALSETDQKEVKTRLLFHRDKDNNTVFHYMNLANTSSLNLMDYLLSNAKQVVSCADSSTHPLPSNSPTQEFADLLHGLVNQEGTHPLHWAAGHGHIAYVQKWIEQCGLPCDMRNCFGCLPSHFAASRGHIPVLSYLAKIYAQSMSKIQNYSIETQQFEVEYLLKCNHHGHDCLTKAIAFRQNEVANWLLSHYPPLRTTIAWKRPWSEETIRSKHHEVSKDPLTGQYTTFETLPAIALLVNNTKGFELLQQYL